MEFNVKEVEDYRVFLSSHGSSEQEVYTVVWKNWSTDMFVQYNFKEEARESTTVVDNTIAANDNLPVPPHPFVYDEEYYNRPPINFKVEHNPNESDLEFNDQLIVIADTIVVNSELHVVHHPYPNSSIPFLRYCIFCCVKQ
jgi:hypothetical protein